METFSALLAHNAGNSPVIGEFPSQRPVTRSFGAFFDLRLNKRLSKQSKRRWFETPSRSLWRHCNVVENSGQYQTLKCRFDRRNIAKMCKMNAFVSKLLSINALWPNDAIWRHKCASTLAHVMACGLTARRQIAWLMMNFCQRYSVAFSSDQFERKLSWYQPVKWVERYTCKLLRHPRGEWVNWKKWCLNV